MIGSRSLLICVNLICGIFAGGFDTSNHSCFYIYEWKDYFSDVWPSENATLIDRAYRHEFRANNGAGISIRPDIGSSNIFVVV
jgi:hypothetical protein